MSQQKVYLDHAATTPLDLRVLEAMQPFLTTEFANPSSFHTPGKRVRDAIDSARAKVAEGVGARPDEIIFTSGGTEANNLALLGYARAHQAEGKHIISARTEHESVLEPLGALERAGFEITWLEVDDQGLVNVGDVERALRPETILVSIMMANNEIGTIAPVAKIGATIERARQAGETKAVFHSDACQALGDQELRVEALHVDLLTVNSSKIYGPKGVGALYIKRGLKLAPLMFGGAQERQIRPGTENVIGIIGFARAVEIATTERVDYVKKIAPLRDRLIEGVLASVPKTRLNGHPNERLANNVNISFLDVEGEALLLYLDAAGIAAATGSACTSASLDPSHVILALGVPYEVAHGSIRFSLGRDTTQDQIDYVIETLPPLVEKLRKISAIEVDSKYL